jgi:hypothetical protein
VVLTVVVVLAAAGGTGWALWDAYDRTHVSSPAGAVPSG